VAITNRYTAIPDPQFTRSLGTLDLGMFMISANVLAIFAVLAAAGSPTAPAARATRIQEATGDRPVTWWRSLLICSCRLFC
jgi:general L-amino acid transport system permease protein